MYKPSKLRFTTICSLAAVNIFTSNGYSQPLGLTPIPPPPPTEPKPGTRGGCLVIPFVPYIGSSASTTIVKTRLPNPTIWIYVKPLEGSMSKQEQKVNLQLSIFYTDPVTGRVSINNRNRTFEYLSIEKTYESKIESFTLPVVNSKQGELEIDKPYEINISCGGLGNEQTVIIQRIANTETMDKNLSINARITKFAASNLWLETVDTLINNSKCKPSKTIVNWLEELVNIKLSVRDESSKIMTTFKKQFIDNCKSGKGNS